MSVTIGSFVIDVAEAEQHEFPCEVTAYPIETGADVADHVRLLPIAVTIEGVVTDTPIGSMVSLRSAGQVGQIALQSAPSADAYEEMQRIRTAREPITLVTSLGTFDRMILESLSVPRSSSTGDSFAFRATFRQVAMITNERTVVEVAVPRASKKKSVGTKVPATVDAPKKTKSGGTAWQRFTAWAGLDS